MKNYMKPRPVEIEKCEKCGTEVKSFMLNREGICGDCLSAKWDAQAKAHSAAHPMPRTEVSSFFGGEDNFTAVMTKADYAALSAECEVERIKQEKLDAMMEYCQ